MIIPWPREFDRFAAALGRRCPRLPNAKCHNKDRSDRSKYYVKRKLLRYLIVVSTFLAITGFAIARLSRRDDPSFNGRRLSD